MVAITNDNEYIYNANQFIDWLAGHGFDMADLSWLLLEAVETTEFKNSLYKQIHDHYNMDHPQDGLVGDDLYRYEEHIANIKSDIQDEINALRSKSRKGNTKEDIANRLDKIVSNL